VIVPEDTAVPYEGYLSVDGFLETAHMGGVVLVRPKRRAGRAPSSYALLSPSWRRHRPTLTVSSAATRQAIIRTGVRV
jgi:hypothetical protein